MESEIQGEVSFLNAIFLSFGVPELLFLTTLLRYLNASPARKWYTQPFMSSYPRAKEKDQELMKVNNWKVLILSFPGNGMMNARNGMIRIPRMTRKTEMAGMK